MDITINILLAIFGLGATLSAFGGETWLKGSKPLIKRITMRGWVSLTCISIAFLIGVYKEVRENNKKIDKETVENQLRKNEKEQQQKIDKQVELIAELQRQIENSQKNVIESTESIAKTTDKLGDQQLSSIESAFSLAVKIPREMDDSVININGNYEQFITSRHGGEMVLFWGDSVEINFIPPSKRTLQEPKRPEKPTDPLKLKDYERKLNRYNHKYEKYLQNLSRYSTPKPDELLSLKLSIDEKEYTLHDGITEGYFNKSIRIYGNSPRPMTAKILNPNGLRNVKIKIFVRSSDSTRGQKEFRRLVLNSPFKEFARQKYKVTLADILRMRESPNTSSRIISQLTYGSFVKLLQTSNGWSEVITPEGRQGWVATQYIGELE